MRIAVIVAALSLATASAFADEAACVEAAFGEYNKANIAIMTQSAPVMSIDATIAQRRLQERYCLRVAQCRVDGQDSAALIATIFSICLDDEARERLKIRDGAERSQ
jgi:hypothetical protein